MKKNIAREIVAALLAFFSHQFVPFDTQQPAQRVYHGPNRWHKNSPRKVARARRKVFRYSRKKKK